jgi:hypothetical protein
VERQDTGSVNRFPYSGTELTTENENELEIQKIIMSANKVHFLDFKLPSCSECCIVPFG